MGPGNPGENGYGLGTGKEIMKGSKTNMKGGSRRRAIEKACSGM